MPPGEGGGGGGGGGDERRVTPAQHGKERGKQYLCVQTEANPCPIDASALGLEDVVAALAPPCCRTGSGTGHPDRGVSQGVHTSPCIWPKKAPKRAATPSSVRVVICRGHVSVWGLGAVV